jgi:hypothetical protein
MQEVVAVLDFYKECVLRYHSARGKITQEFTLADLTSF